MNEDERGRVGRLLKRRREDQGLRQADIAAKTGLSVGTVQAIEFKKYRVHDANIEKYAIALGTTTYDLLHPAAPGRAIDPQFADLNREHLTIARLYMRAVKVVRTAVEVLLPERPEFAEVAEDLAAIVVVFHMAADRYPTIVADLARSEFLFALVEALARDPGTEQRLRYLIEQPPEPNNDPMRQKRKPK